MNKNSMEELKKIIERYTEGNYLIGNTVREEMANDILALFNVSKKQLDEAKQIAYDKGCYDGYKDCKNSF